MHLLHGQKTSINSLQTKANIDFFIPKQYRSEWLCFWISDKPFLSTSKSTVSLIEIKLESQVVRIPAVLRIKTFSKILRKTTFKSFGASLFLCLVLFVGSPIRSSRSFSTSLISFEFYLCYSSLRTSDKCSSLPLTSYHPGSDFLRCKQDFIVPMKLGAPCIQDRVSSPQICCNSHPRPPLLGSSLFRAFFLSCAVL